MTEKVATYERSSEEELAKIAKFFRVFANEKRVLLLRYLCKDDYSSWNDIFFTLKLNPKTQRDHLKILQTNRMVEHLRGRGFRATDYGKESLEVVDRVVEGMIRRLVKVGYEFPFADKEERESVYKRFL